MIVGIGIDSAEIRRIEKAASRESFRTMVYTDAEQAYALQRGRGWAESLAAAYAAKEAVSKALGCGMFRYGPKTMELTHNEDGVPGIRLNGLAVDEAHSLGVNRIHVSVTHDTTRAIAFVILEKRERR